MKSSSFSNFILILNFFLKRQKTVLFVIILLLFLTSAIEGIGLVALIPLFEIILNNTNNINNENFLSNLILNFFDLLNFNLNILSIIIFIILIFFIKYLFLLFTFNFISFISAKIQSEFQKDLIYYTFDSKWNFFNKKSLGLLSNTIGLETKIIANMFQRVCAVFSGFLQSVLVFIIALTIDVYYSILAFCIGLIIFFLFSFLTKIAKKVGKKQTYAQQNLLKKYNDILQGLKSYKASERILYIKYYILKHVIELKNSNFKLNFYKYLQNYSKEPVIILVVCFFLIINVNSQLISYNTLIIFIILLYRVLVSLNLIQINYTNILSQFGYFESVNNLMSDFSINLEKNNNFKKIIFEKRIKFENISFNYGNKHIFNNLSFTIKKNSITLIYGESGVGKTSLIDLISGLHKPDKGKIIIDDKNLDEYNIFDWRKNIEYVQQELFLINDSVRENITFGNKNISDELIWGILDKINATKFVSTLPNKLDYVVGERGTLLSGGQRQRLALGRSIINNPKILILDEITASLDSENEEIIFNYLLKLKNNMTIIIVSHQKYLEKYADQVLYLKNL